MDDSCAAVAIIFSYPYLVSGLVFGHILCVTLSCSEKKEWQVVVLPTVLGHIAAVHTREPAAPAAFTERSDA